jgi:hypothetical protein
MKSIVVLFILGFIWPLFYSLGKLSILVVVGLVFVDSILLYSKRDGVLAERIMANKLSNGDKNNISIYIQNNYSFQTQIEILDEIPHQFQIRDFLIKLSLNANQQKVRVISHHHLLRPPIKVNIEALKKISSDKKNKTYLVSSRFGFLKGRTEAILKRYKLKDYFSGAYFNYKNEQPHIFKERIIKKPWHDDHHP